MPADSPDRILRDPQAAAGRKYDAIIVGGGIYGTMLLMEASLRGLRAVLLEKGDFGGGTSFNSLRIVHGGLRYLQSADLPRFFESVSERRWYLRAFPDLVAPLTCLMPLYGTGLHRPAILRLALAANDFLSINRNRGVRGDRILPHGYVLDPEETVGRFPQVRREGLAGAAVWCDAAVPDSHRLVIEVLRFACARGGTAMNYVAGVSLLEDRGRVTGVLARDLAGQQELRFAAPVVVNATGPWVTDTATRFGGDPSSLFHPSLAWNALFDRDALSDHALAVSAPGPGSHMYFLNPWKGRLLIGTIHSPFSGDIDSPAPDDSQVAAFLADINEAIPGIDLRISDVSRLFCGLLPAADASGEGLAVRPQIRDHGRAGGPPGLFSVSGIKLTTARRVAAALFDKVTGQRAATGATAAAALARQADERLQRAGDWDLTAGCRTRQADPAAVRAGLQRLVDDEAVLCRDDLVMRRTTLWELADGEIDFLSLDRWPFSASGTGQAEFEGKPASSQAKNGTHGDRQDMLTGEFAGSGVESG